MARKKKKQEEDDGDPFMVLFTALSMIMLAFFIMLNSIAVVDDGRTRKAMSSLVGTFGVMRGSKSNVMGPFSNSFNDVQNVSSDAPTEKELVEFVSTQREIDMELLRRKDGRLVLRMDAEMLFLSGGIELAPRYYGTLDKLARLLGLINQPVLIEGHADAKVPAGGRSNWYYSAARAVAVYRYLSEGAGLDPGLLSAVGHGNTRPMEGALGKQRRVEFVFLPKTTPASQVTP